MSILQLFVPLSEARACTFGLVFSHCGMLAVHGRLRSTRGTVPEQPSHAQDWLWFNAGSGQVLAQLMLRA